jgi:hypothetical protein
MVYLVATETLLLVLVLLLVAGLLRSHAETLRSLHDLTAHGAHTAAQAGDDIVLPEILRPHPIAGEALDRSPVVFDPARRPDVLLAFLDSGCSTCRPLFEGMKASESTHLPASSELVIVAKDRHEESIGRLRKLVPEWASLILAGAAWRDYGIPGSPYFIHVRGGEILGHGTAKTWPAALSFAEDAATDLDEDAILALARQA